MSLKRKVTGSIPSSYGMDSAGKRQLFSIYIRCYQGKSKMDVMNSSQMDANAWG